MTTQMNELFSTEVAEGATKSVRALEGTAQLTSLANEIVSSIMKTVECDIETYKPMIAASKESHDAMDDLVNKVYDLTIVDISFLTALDTTVLENMLRSQQSKRSRAKGKDMTMDNYRNMMNAAVAENLIRKALGKSKTVSFSVRRSSKLDFTEEELQELAKNQGEVRREIRNVQSKKSIMKSKEGFSEDSEAWQQLCELEAKLKSIRTEWTPEPKQDKTQGKLAEMLKDIDPDSMKAVDVKALLAQVKELV